MMRYQEGFDADILIEKIRPLYQDTDPAHDFSHIMRVYQNARRIGLQEAADMKILLLAALLHDANSRSKNSPTSGESDCSRRAVKDLLREIGLPDEAKQKVLYAIKVHRFSKGIVPTTLEAKILQDADRLDAMGAIGIARVFLTGGSLGRRMYHPDDPFCRSRDADDKSWNLDHFFSKLLKLEEGMHTKTARTMAKKRATVLKNYLRELQRELEDEYEKDGDKEMERPEVAELQYVLHPKSEIDSRIKKLQSRMEDLTGAILLDSVNLGYFSGTTQEGLIYIPRDSSPVVRIKKSQQRAAQESPLDVGPQRSLKSLKSDLNIPSGATIGLELDVLPYNNFARIAGALGDVKFIDVSERIKHIRSVKSDFEIGLIKAGSPHLGCWALHPSRTIW